MSTVYDTSAEGSKDIITWEESIASLLQEKMQTRRRRQEDSDAPFLVALVDIPGSGKSTSAHKLSALLPTRDIPNTTVPMHGYNYSLSTLQSFPNAQDVIYRRGAPDTFDTRLLLRDLDCNHSGGRSELVEFFITVCFLRVNVQTYYFDGN